MKAVLIALLAAVLCAEQGKELWRLEGLDGEDEEELEITQGEHLLHLVRC